MASADVVFSIKAEVGESVASLKQVEQELAKTGDAAASAAQRTAASMGQITAAERAWLAQSQRVRALATQGERERQAAAEREHRATQQALADMRARVTMAQQVRAAMAGTQGISASDRGAVNASLASAAGGDRSALVTMFAQGKISADQFAASMKLIGANTGQAQGALSQLRGLISGGLMTAVTGFGAAVVAAFSVRAIVDFGKMAVAEAVRAEDAQNRLTMALNAQGQASAGLQSALRKQAEELQHTTRFSDEAVREMQALALNIGVMPGNLHSFTAAATDLASALGMDLVTAGRQLAQTLDGDAGRLKQMIPELAALSEEQLRAGAAIDIVREKFQGFAQQDLATLGGGLAQLKNELGESVEGFGIAVTGASDFGGAVRKAAEWIRNDFAPAMETMGEVAGTTIRFLGDVIDRLDKISAWLPPVWLAKGASWAVGKIEGGGVDENADFAQQVFLDRRKFGAGGEEGAGLREAAADAAAMDKSRRALADIQNLYKGIIAGAEEQEKAAERAAERAQQEQEAIHKKIAGFVDQINLNEKLIEQGDALYGSKADELKALESAEAKTRSILEQLREMVLLGGPAGAAAQDIITPMEMTLSGIEQRQAPGELLGGIGPLDTIDPMETTTRSSERELQAQAGQELSTGLAKYDQEIQGIMALMDAQTNATQALAEYNAQRQYEAEMSTLLAEGRYAEADALQKVYTAELAAMEAKKRHAAQATMSRQMHMAFGSALQQTAGAFVQMAIAGEISGKKLLATTLQSLSQIAQQKMIEQLALAWAAIGSHGASGNPAAHFSSAAIWGTIAIGAGAAAGAVGGGGSGKEGKDDKGGGRELDGFGGFGSANANRAAIEDAPGRGPTYQVTITGNVTSAGGTEELARMLRGELQRLDSDSGGRATTPRL